MTKYKIWDKKRDLYPPAGEKYTAEDVFKKWGWTRNPDSVVVITENGGVLQSINNLEILKSIHDVTAENAEDALAQIEEKVNAPRAETPVESRTMTHGDAMMLGQILTDIQLNTLK